MKKVLLLLSFIACCMTANAIDWGYYASLRMNSFYLIQDEDFMTNQTSGFDNDTRVSFDGGLQGNSRIGLTVNEKAYSGKFEAGISDYGVSLRQLYVTYVRDEYSLLIGKTYTGFSELTSQVYGSDNGLIGSGLFYTGRVAQVKVSREVDGYNAYAAFLQPRHDDGDRHIFIPRLNVGIKFDRDNINYHFTSGLSYESFDKDISANEGDILSYVLSATAKTQVNDIGVKAQVNFGQNVKNYGISCFGEEIYPKTSKNDNSFEDVMTLAGYLELSKNNFNVALAYMQNESDALKDADGKLTIYANFKHNLWENLFISPEVGMIDHMENGNGVKEGTEIYFGAKLQADI